MTRAKLSNLHVPLPQGLYERLRAEASRSGRPATILAREAIEEWLHERARQQVGEEISAYASALAGTAADLDPALERAASNHLRGKRRK